MKEEVADEIINCLPRGKTPYYYFKDKYALDLLASFVGSGKTIKEIKESKFKGLLNKPLLKEIIKNLGDGVLTKELLDLAWSSHVECYLLTLGKWDYHQTTRNDTNLVLQLNFSNKHDKPYEKLIDPDETHPFMTSYHPIAGRGYHTLAWARIDLEMSMAGNDALIEEIQTDWLRYAMDWKHYQIKTMKNEQKQALKTYINEVLFPHFKLWDEAILSAAIWFLKEEIGMKRIFYHTYESGSRLKGIYYDQPPRSIYTDLPKKFNFRKTTEIPEFLNQKWKKRIKRLQKIKELEFFVMD